jgi:hypothetical protein
MLRSINWDQVVRNRSAQKYHKMQQSTIKSLSQNIQEEYKAAHFFRRKEMKE